MSTDSQSDMNKPMNNQTQSVNDEDEHAERRQKVMLHSIRGLTQRDIARELGVSQPTISRDLAYLKEQANEFLKELSFDLYALLYQQSLQGLAELIKEAWKLYEETKNIKTLYFLKECYLDRRELARNHPDYRSEEDIIIPRKPNYRFI